MIQGTSLKFYSKPVGFFPTQWGQNPSARSSGHGLSRWSLCHGLCLKRGRSRSGLSWRNPKNEWQEPQEQQPTKNGGITEFRWSVDIVDVFFFLKMWFYLALSENRVYSQWNSHLIGIMIINHWVSGYTIVRHSHLLTSSLSRSEDRDGESALFTVKKLHGHPAHLIFQTISDTPTYPLVYNLLHSYWKWPFIVDLPIKHGGSFHTYVSLPEGNFETVRCLVKYIPSLKNTHDMPIRLGQRRLRPICLLSTNMYKCVADMSDM